MTCLLSLITLLCTPNLQAASASAGAAATAAPTAVAADENKAALSAIRGSSASTTTQSDPADVKTAAGERARSGVPYDAQRAFSVLVGRPQAISDAAIAAAADEPEMKVRMGGVAGPIVATQVKPNQQEVIWSELNDEGMREQYRRILREGSPRLVTSPAELLIHLDFAAMTLFNSLGKQHKGNPVASPQDLYRIYKNLFSVITFPQDPTMLHIVQMALDGLRERDNLSTNMGSFLEDTCRTWLFFLHANARRRIGVWMEGQELSSKMWLNEKSKAAGCDDAITKDLYRQELVGEYGHRFRNASEDSAASDPALILEVAEAEVRSFLKNHTSYGYGDVYAIASKVLKSIRLPKGTIAFAPVVWAIELCTRKNEGQTSTPFSSLRALVLNHLHVVCCQEVVSKVEDGKLVCSNFLDDIFALPGQLLPHLLPGDEKLSRTFLALNSKRALYNCYRARFDSMSKFLQGKPITQGATTTQLDRPLLLSLSDYQREQESNMPVRLTDDFVGQFGPRTEDTVIRANRVHGLALLDLTVAQDPTDIIVQYCTDPGWSIEYAEKMRKTGNCRGELLDIDVVERSATIAKLNQRGLNNLKGLELLFGIRECHALEVSCNPLSELNLRPLLLCHQQGMQLQSLDLSKNSLVEIDLGPLSQIKTLRNLYLRDNELVGIEGLSAIIPQLQRFDIAENRLENIVLHWIHSSWLHQHRRALGLDLEPQKIVSAPLSNAEKFKLGIGARVLQQVTADRIHGLAPQTTPPASKDQKKKLQKKHGKAHRPNAS